MKTPDPILEENLQNLLKSSLEAIPQPSPQLEAALLKRLQAEMPKPAAEFPFPTLTGSAIILLLLVGWLIGQNNINSTSLFQGLVTGVLLLNLVGVFVATIIIIYKRKKFHVQI